MKAKEQWDDFNMKLLEGLNKMEKKLDKESGSSKSGSHKTSDEKRKARSVSRHHHHSQRNSNKRAVSSSSPSPVRRHNKSRVDELWGDMKKIKPPTFDGEHKRMKMQKHGCWAWESTFNCIIILLLQKVELLSINSREKPLCGGIILCRCNTLKRKVVLEGNSRSILRRNTWIRDTMTRKWKSSLNSSLEVWP